MASTRSVISPGIFAADATTTIPPTPIQGVSYRDPVAGPASAPDGWPFFEKVNSAEFNQLMFQYSSLLDTMDLKGVLGWTDLKDYTEAAIAFGSDGSLYFWLQESGPGTAAGVKDPTTEPTYWAALPTPSASDRFQIGDPVYVTATDTVIHPAGYAHVRVELVGGGAGGGSAVGNSTQTAGAAGGGSGRFAEAVLTAATVGASTLCTIGAGGAGGTAGGAGGVGGTTSFGAHVTAGGGASGEGASAGATLNVSNGGAGGTASTGADYASNGGPGGNGVTYGSTSVNRGIAGDGGASHFGGGGAGKALVGSDVYPGVAGGSPGSGGSGAGVGSSSGTTQLGGAGAPGLIRLTYYK